MSSTPVRRVLGSAFALLLPFVFNSCETLPMPFGSSEEQVEAHARTVLTQEQAAKKFFEAYKHHNRFAASQVASPKAIQKLRWNPLAAADSHLELQETDQGDWVILYNGGFMELIIHGDGHVGHTVTDIDMTAD